MKENYSDEHQRKGKTDYEFLKDRMRNYLSPVKTYFELKKIYDAEKNKKEKEKMIKFLEKAEKRCHKNIDKIGKLLKRD